MSDTLAHLVGATKDRADSSKFLYILNQIDTTAREDNPEEVIGAWQRALAREGLTAGRFYSIYDPEAAVPIENEALRRRFEWKRDQDLGDIHQRIEQVSVERAYRIVGALEKRAHEIEEHYVPEIRGLIASWRRKVLGWDIGYLLLAAMVGAGAMLLPPAMANTVKTAFQQLLGNQLLSLAAAVMLAALVFYLHFTARGWASRKVMQEIPTLYSEDESERMARAFKRNTRIWRSIFDPDPAGWSGRNRRALKRIVCIIQGCDLDLYPRPGQGTGSEEHPRQCFVPGHDSHYIPRYFHQGRGAVESRRQYTPAPRRRGAGSSRFGGLPAQYRM